MSDRLIVRGAREHNLKDVSLDLPRDALIVFTGLSGSGKSSLAFDTIFAEGQRRYVESLSAYARQFLGQMDKPDVDFIEGLSPAVSIDQKSTSRNPRSTVGTITEVYDYLRLLYARAGTPHCPVCGRPIGRQSPQADRRPGPRARRGHPVPGAGAGHPGAQGRVRRAVPRPADQGLQPGAGRRGRPHPHRAADAEEAGEAHDRGGRRPARGQARPPSAGSPTRSRRRSALGGGLVTLDFVDLPEDDPHRERRFSEHLGLPQRRPVVRGARAAVVLVQQPVRRLPGLHRPRHPHGGRPRAGRARPDHEPRRGRARAVVARRTPATTSAGWSRRSATRWASAPTCPWARLPAKAQQGAARGPRRPGPRPLQEPLRPRAVLLHRASRA